jgi:tRNA1Val (adenine37-N6)-methyltransferase
MISLIESGFESNPNETVDRLTSRIRIIQKRGGHRAASDDTLLAWAAARACPGAIRVLDLGSGKGTVAMLLLQRLPHCRVIGVEALEVSHDLAIRNARLNSLADRWDPRLGDLRDPSVLADEPLFDLVTGAPPFMPVGSGVVPADAQRAAGRFEFRGGIRDYVEAGARYLAPHGRLVLLMDGAVHSRVRTERALSEWGFCPHIVLGVIPQPAQRPVYLIFVAGSETVSTTEERICMRADRFSGFSTEYDSIRRDMDCIPGISS